MKLEIKVRKPEPPKFLYLEGVATDGRVFTKPGRIPLSDITEEEAVEFSELLRFGFMAEWRKQNSKKQGATLTSACAGHAAMSETLEEQIAKGTRGPDWVDYTEDGQP